MDVARRWSGGPGIGGVRLLFGRLVPHPLRLNCWSSRPSSCVAQLPLNPGGQCDVSTGAGNDASTERVAPPNSRSRKRAWP